jgi:threonine dehydrogenase-like Zn-dependent dehydrogenase
LLVPLAFLVIIGTVLIQSMTAKRLASWLRVREPPPTGVLIVGAGNVARAIAKALREKGFKVVLTDSNWENTSAARMEGLDTYYGNPISEHADRHLDLVGIGRMLAMSGRGNLDALASLRFKTEFGAQGVYELRPDREKAMSHKHRISTKHRGNQLFGEEITYGTIATWLRNCAEIRSTQLSGEFGFEAYRQKYGERILPMFGIDTKSRLRIFTADKPPLPEPGWTIMSLVLPETAAA